MPRRYLLPFLLACPIAAAFPQQPPATAPEAARYMARVERTLDSLSIEQSRAEWVAANFITEDTEALSAGAQRAYSLAVQRLAAGARRFDRLKLPPDLRRKFLLLKISVSAPPPADPAQAAELTRITVSMDADYGKGTCCRPGKAGGEECLQISELSRVLAREPGPRRICSTRGKGGTGWARPMREPLHALRRARQLGGARDRVRRRRRDVALRLRHDRRTSSPREADRLWDQVKPLYLSLHAYARGKLVEQYGARAGAARRTDPGAPARQHVGAEVGNVYPAAWRRDSGASRRRPHRAARSEEVDAGAMAKLGEGVLHLARASRRCRETFWKRSLFVKPRDREVVCHASAWDVDNRRRRAHQDVHRAQRPTTSSPCTTSSGTTTTSAPTTS